MIDTNQTDHTILVSTEEHPVNQQGIMNKRKKRKLVVAQKPRKKKTEKML